jgi:organic radical activating enzyme
MIHLPNCEFYITHTCNLSCNHCHTFNDLAIGGHYDWTSTEHIYRRWAEIMDIARICIMGGEPLTNPHYLEWLTNIAQLWPRAKIIVYTNGTQFHRQPDLYKTIVELNNTRPGIIEIFVSAHDQNHQEPVFKFIKTYMIEPRTFDRYLEDKQVAEHAVAYQDKNGVILNIKQNGFFHENSLKINRQTKQVDLYHSDPEKAFKICNMKTCHHMENGLLYKCGPMGVLPFVLEKFQINARPEDIDLLYSYKPASVDWPLEEVSNFVEELKRKQSIPQCSFCPEEFTPHPVYANEKKIVLIKKKENTNTPTNSKVFEQPGVDKV